MEFGEAMEKDFSLALKRFWQTVRQLGKGKQAPTYTVPDLGGQLLTQTGAIVSVQHVHL